MLLVVPWVDSVECLAYEQVWLLTRYRGWLRSFDARLVLEKDMGLRSFGEEVPAALHAICSTSTSGAVVSLKQALPALPP